MYRTKLAASGAQSRAVDPGRGLELEFGKIIYMLGFEECIELSWKIKWKKDMQRECSIQNTDARDYDVQYLRKWSKT